MDEAPVFISENDNEPIYYDLGGDAILTLSKKIKVDGVFTDMDPGYPLVTTQGSKTIYTFKFPKGDVIEYDPGVDFGVEDPTTSPTLTPPTPTPPSPTPPSPTPPSPTPDDDTDDMDDLVGGSANTLKVSGLAVLALVGAVVLV